MSLHALKRFPQKICISYLDDIAPGATSVKYIEFYIEVKNCLKKDLQTFLETRN